MITLIYGTNAFAVRQALQDIMATYAPEEIERRDGAEVAPEQMSDLLQGASLFSSKKLVIIKDAAAQKSLWSEIAEWIEKVPEETDLVLVEDAPDKRTKTFKALQKHARMVECPPLDERAAVQWVMQQAPKMVRDTAKLLVDRVGTDQWQLSHEVEKLVLKDDMSAEAVRETAETTPQAQVFALLDSALAMRAEEVQRLVADCAGREDPYKFFGLLAGQVFQLAAMHAAGSRTPEVVAKDIGAHPYPLKKLQATARRLTYADMSRLVSLAAQLDEDMKHSKGEPWLLLERTLVQMATERV